MKYRIIYHKTVTSTNDVAHEFACGGCQEGLVLVSEYQTKGRGRYQRKWTSKKGENLLFTVVVRPKCPSHKAPSLTYHTAKAVKETIEKITDLSCTIKRPNDILVEKKKIAGILTETHSRKGSFDYAAIGIGINVNSTKKSLIRTATSVRIETGKKHDRDIILKTFLKQFKKEYQLFEKDIRFAHKRMKDEIVSANQMNTYLKKRGIK